MAQSSPNRLRPEPPPTVLAAFRRRLGEHELRTMGTLFALRRTAQQVDNAVTEWLSGAGGSIARFQVMSILWASADAGVPHKEIVATLGVTRATVSGLMAGMERDGLVQSEVDAGDRRNLLASLTEKGRVAMDGAFEVNVARMQTAFGSLSEQEMTIFTDLLARIRQGFAEAAGG
jgi:DNA-binding MarR family transcriptional regulator